MNSNRIADFKNQQALQEEASHLGLSGLAVVASHKVIEANILRGGEKIVMLIQQGNHEEALRLMNLPGWGTED